MYEGTPGYIAAPWHRPHRSYMTRPCSAHSRESTAVMGFLQPLSACQELWPRHFSVRSTATPWAQVDRCNLTGWVNCNTARQPTPHLGTPGGRMEMPDVGEGRLSHRRITTDGANSVPGICGGPGLLILDASWRWQVLETETSLDGVDKHSGYALVPWLAYLSARFPATRAEAANPRLAKMAHSSWPAGRRILGQRTIGERSRGQTATPRQAETKPGRRQGEDWPAASFLFRPGTALAHRPAASWPPHPSRTVREGRWWQWVRMARLGASGRGAPMRRWRLCRKAACSSMSKTGPREGSPGGMLLAEPAKCCPWEASPLPWRHC